MKKILLFLMILLLVSGCGKKEKNKEIDDSFERNDILADEVKDCNVPVVKNDYHIAWSEEFNYEGVPSSDNWSYEVGTGNGGWGNNELQTYTNRVDNSYVSDGSLKITAKRENYNGSDYTSARLVSRDKADFKYGYIEISAKLAGGVGSWPALWMMPTDSVYGGWPNSGEIDIMEYQGRNPNYAFSTVHTTKNHGSGISSGRKPVKNAETEFHKYAMEWTEDYMIFYYDDVQIHRYNNPKRTSNPEQYWPFDQKFYFVLNVAVGGTLGGTVANDFQETSMYVDYIRVYKKSLKGIDTEKPGTVSFNSYNASNSSINLDWTDAEDNYGIKQYDVVVNGKQVGSTINTNYVIKNLDPNTDYTVQIIAVDYAGNYKVSPATIISTKDILKAPGKIEVEFYSTTKNTFVINNPQGGQSVDISNVNNENGYVILEVEAKAGTYNIELFAMVPRNGMGVKVYVVDENYNGQSTEAYELTSSPGVYNVISLNNKLELKDGKNFIKIEGYSSKIGKVITIDNMTLVKK